MPHADLKGRAVPKPVSKATALAVPVERWSLLITYKQVPCDEGPVGLECATCEHHHDTENRQIVDLLRTTFKNNHVAPSFDESTYERRIVSQWETRSLAVKAAGGVLTQFSRVAVSLEPAKA